MVFYFLWNQKFQNICFQNHTPIKCFCLGDWNHFFMKLIPAKWLHVSTKQSQTKMYFQSFHDCSVQASPIGLDFLSISKRKKGTDFWETNVEGKICWGYWGNFKPVIRYRIFSTSYSSIHNEFSTSSNPLSLHMILVKS